MTDLSQVPTEDLILMRGKPGIDLSNVTTEDLMKMRGVPHGTKSTKTMKSTGMGDLVGAAIEPNVTLASVMGAMPLAGLLGIAGSILPGPEGQGADWTRKTLKTLTYSPDKYATEGGK